LREDDDSTGSFAEMHPPHRCISRQERKILKKDEQFKQQQNHHMHVFSDLQ
jgi:hypothetical protein